MRTVTCPPLGRWGALLRGKAPASAQEWWAAKMGFTAWLPYSRRYLNLSPNSQGGPCIQKAATRKSLLPMAGPLTAMSPAALPSQASSSRVFHSFPVLSPHPTVASLHCRCPRPNSNCFPSLGWEGGQGGFLSNPFHTDALTRWDSLVYVAVTNSTPKHKQTKIPFLSCLCHLTAVWSWARYLTSLALRVFTCDMGEKHQEE